MDHAAERLVTVHESKFGKGIFATQNISKGSPIMTIHGEKLNFSDSLELGDWESYCLQVGIDNYIVTEPPFRFSNHSCDPNAGINSNLELFALRAIAKNEEIVWDYSSSMLERHWTMLCHCGSLYCRRQVTDFDFLPKQTQERYIELGIVFPFIVTYLEQKAGSGVLAAVR